ncbi:NAD(P)-dependent dehydrogenase (short-subunit alcohol dehydrogenase family) [Phyllobacterium sp. 1468]|uniref:SDR family NAD(P)-dependent oxidoreductase n=1 Tax=Phyllobacterium sp. 1468 TaxID=2817759 RepID=UPI00286423DF|nr:SDR family NAD(P)-dependent oxidoreductase [Phyllobacterium sp. 1468]MDR6632617.1 NAD(P)-dependent dehydrogenase (short-subunit alcohol dehydrogenase family) [Phyllobacterium sp. 1468]
MTDYRTALIIGAGPGISASLTRALTASGVRVAMAARDTFKLSDLAAETGARAFSIVDAADQFSIEQLFEEVDQGMGTPDVVVYNASARAHGPIAELDPNEVQRAISITAFGGFLAVHHAAKRMVPNGRGAILLTGASASIKGFPHSAAFAMGKFALRGLAQSAARELGPKGIHVAHFIIDGSVRKAGSSDPADGKLTPDAISQSYMDVLKQPRDAWSHEVDLRPWAEKF